MEDTSLALIHRRKWRVRCSRTSSTRRRIYIRVVVTATAHSRSQVAPRPQAGRICSRQWRKLPPRRGRQAHTTRIPINARNQFILSRTHRRRPRPRVNTRRPLDLLHSTTSRSSSHSQGSNKGVPLPQTDRPFLLINNHRRRHLPPRYPHPRASRRIFRPALATLRARTPSECPRSDPPFPSSSRNRHRNCTPSINHRRPRRGTLPRCRVDCRAPILLPSSTTRISERPSLEATASIASA